MLSGWYQWLTSRTWYRKFLTLEYQRVFGEIPKPPPIAQPSKFGEIKTATLNKLLPVKFITPDGNEGLVRKIFFDDKYRTISKKDIVEFLEKNKVDKARYVAEHGDCDDFAVKLWGDIKDWCDGICLGFLWTNDPSHAKCIFVDIDNVMWEIEPQNDEIIPLDKSNIYTTII